MGRSNKSVVSEVLKRIESRQAPARTKRTLVLTKDKYDKFEALCRSIDKYPSQIIDEFIALFVEEQGK